MIYKCEVQYTIVQEKNFTRKTLYCHADEKFMIPNNFVLTKAVHLDFQELKHSKLFTYTECFTN